MNYNITVLDYNMSNLHSVVSAFEYNDFEVKISSRKKDISNCDCLILPGVGSFNVAMKNLKKTNIIDDIYKHINSNKPIVCICLGMQLLFDESEENENCKGMQILKGKVKKFRFSGNKFTVPHTGWNSVSINLKNSNSLYDDLPQNEMMYFVHSYYVEPSEDNTISSLTSYGNKYFCSSIKYKNIYGFQFHPEKSGKKGLKIYKNIKKIIQ